jgi:hypothetical protein
MSFSIQFDNIDHHFELAAATFGAFQFQRHIRNRVRQPASHRAKWPPHSI